MEAPLEEPPDPRIEALRRALATLPPDQRMLVLRYHQEDDHIRSRQALSEELGIPMNALRIRVHRVRRKLEQRVRAELAHTKAPMSSTELMAELPHAEAATTPAEEPKPVSATQASPPPTKSQTPPMESLRHLLQTRFPVLYAQVLEPTLSDLRQEHSAALAERRLLKARFVLLQGCSALMGGAACQLGYALLGRFAALWRARGLK